MPKASSSPNTPPEAPMVSLLVQIYSQGYMEGDTGHPVKAQIDLPGMQGRLPVEPLI